MPILHIQVDNARQEPDGSVVPIPPADSLMRGGPAFKVTLGLMEEMAQQLAQQGQAVPSPVTGWAVIDTGASVTCIDDATAQQLGLPVIEVQRVATASHASIPRNVYPVLIETVGFDLKFNLGYALGVELAAPEIIALIGRDVLRHCTLFYNGPLGQFTLAM